MLNEGVAALVFDCGSGLFWAGFAGYDASFAEFPLVVGRTGMLGIFVGMDQKDRYVATLLFTCPLCATTGAMGYGVEKLWIFRSCSPSTRSSTSLS